MREEIELKLKRTSDRFKRNLKENEGFDLSKFLTHELKDKIRDAIKMFVMEDEEFDEGKFENEYNNAVVWFRANQPVTIEQGFHLKQRTVSWLTDDKKKNIGWGDGKYDTYRDRYFEYLKKIGRPDEVIKEAEASTLRIVENLSDPESTESFFTKALVVGSVQSGKTANFNGVINTALDTGFKLILVLSGITEDLRKQTQERIEKDVIGDNRIGVGADRPFETNINNITSVDNDFSTVVMQTNQTLHNGNGNILICKKNVGILRNILLWLENQKIDNEELTIPMLIIDDEADNASLNNLGHKGGNYASKTNKLIRAILKMTNRKSYLGYTATPFANILQDRNEVKNQKFPFKFRKVEYEFELEDNIFPDHFIELLNPPSNYSGIKHFFDTSNEDIKQVNGLVARPIDLDDPEYYKSIPPRFYKDSNKPTVSVEKGTRSAKSSDDYPNDKSGIPKSLKEAIHCFIITIAMKLAREKKIGVSNLPLFWNKHRTMLIHTSLFSSWQNKLEPLVTKFWNQTVTDLGNDKTNEGIYIEYERLWNKHYEFIVNNIQNDLAFEDEYMILLDFEKDVQKLLYEAGKNIKIKTLNSSTEKKDDDLKYSKNDAKYYIAIGGNRLSRGFTLEGLTINYFLRKANTVDTLMQMARWFGYRPGYLDSCKLFTLRKNIEKFNEASLIMEDLEEKFKYLSSLSGRRPSDFTLWIRNNPDVIKLTRGNFLKGAEVKQLSFSDVVEQGTHFKLEKDLIITSFNEFKNHIKELQWEPADEKKPYLYHDTDQEGFLSFMNLKSTLLNLNILGLKEYLEACKEKNKLTKWRIVLKTSKTEGGKVTLNINNENRDINMIVRSGPSMGDGKNPSTSFMNLTQNNIFKVRNSNISSPTDFSVTLTNEQRKKVEKEYKENNKTKKDKNKSKSVPDMAYREAMDESTGILIIYLLDLPSVFKDDKNDKAEEILKKFSTEKGLEDLTETPLIGYAIGFPKVGNVELATEITQNFFDEPKDMTFEQLQKFVIDKDYNIDPYDVTTWNQENLLDLVLDIEVDQEKAEEEANEETWNNLDDEPLDD